MRGRYGARAPTVLNNHRAKLFLPGIADPDTLEYASRLIGDEEASHPSIARDPTGKRSTTSTTSPASTRGTPLSRPGSGRAGLRDFASGAVAAAAMVGAGMTRSFQGSGPVTHGGAGRSAAFRLARARSSDSNRSRALAARAAARSNSSAASS